MKKYKFIALIPAYNPNELLIDLVDRLNKEKDITIVVVNDGSKEECNKVFKAIKKNCILLEHEVNKGKGAALKTGYSYIKENFDNYIVVTLDCDGQHKIEDAKKLYKYNIEHLDTLVLGSREFDKDVPLRSKLGNTITRYVYKIVSRTTVRDTQTGLRSFSNDLMDLMLEIPGERYEYEINVLLEVAKYEIPIHEITIETIYIDNNSGSHFNPIKDSIKIYKEILKYSLSSIISFCIDFILFKIFLGFFNLQLSNIFARIISASCNFTMNKKFVFKNKGNVFKAIVSYAALAITVLFLNTILLTFLVGLGIPTLLAKLITEVTLFFLSYFIQHSFIFRGGNNN